MEFKESDIANMNINSKSEIFESSSKTKSEMQSCKLDESESKPNVTLKKMGQELNEAETKCFTLKSELNYVMGVCEKVKTEMKDTLRLSSKSSQLSPRRIVDNDDAGEEFESLEHQKQNGLMNVTIIPKTQLDKKLPFAMTTTSSQSETLKASGEYENPMSFSEYMREHLQSMMNVEDSIEEFTADENYFHVIPPISVKKDIRDAKLNLNIQDTAKFRREKSKRASRMERSESNSIYNKTGHMLSKMRKRKGRLRSSVSKSTVATKDTSFGRKEVKKRKHRGHGIIHQLSNPPKNLKKSNDVVEIFHNTTLKNSNSEISNSKHSKFDKQTKSVKRHPTETANQKIREISYSERVNHEYQFDNKENEQHQCPQSLNYQCDSKVIHDERVQEHDISEKHSKDFYPSVQYNKTHQSEHNAFNKCNDPMFIPSYEMPTLASRLKRSNRSYFNRFNFRNIPFVVGTSVTPSHNLGLNIQQVLSVMKTRQPVANDVTPLLIRKVSRGMKPMSILLEQMNDYSQKSALNINSHLSGIFNNSDSSYVKRDKKLSVFNLQHVENITPNVGSAKLIPEKDNNIAKQFNKEKIHVNDHKIKLQSPVVNKNMSMNVKNQQGVAKISSNKEINIGDYKTRAITDAHNSKEMRNILINLHDQFEELNTKYEKLQSEVEKSDDKSLAKELSAIEKELNIKEEEINAVIGLYKEVKTLKQQMKTLHEKNSLVCITTESVDGSHKNSFPMSILSGKSHSMNPSQIFGRRKFNATREPPTSMQLAALLRQIQIFYKQMQLVS